MTLKFIYLLLKKYRKKCKTLPAFSLIELAIGIVIIGIILSFALKGHEVYEEAKLHSIMSQVSQFRLAHFNFFERYGALPGDFNQAKELIDTRLNNGDGDGIISKGHDSANYWKHLSMANVLMMPLNDQGLPTSKLGGVFVVKHDTEASRPGIWYRLGNFQGEENDGPLLTPQQAYFLDKKYDTGNSETGRIRFATGKGARARCTTPDNQYNLKTTERSCVVFFQL